MAFHTRYSLYKWLITPFSLMNSPATFQRYINYTLHKYLDKFISVYLNDTLIYTDGSLKDY